MLNISLKCMVNCPSSLGNTSNQSQGLIRGKFYYDDFQHYLGTTLNTRRLHIFSVVQRSLNYWDKYQTGSKVREIQFPGPIVFNGLSI